MNPKTVAAVAAGSPAARAGVRAGDRLAAISGNAIRDVLDYKYFSYDRRVTLEIIRGGKMMRLEIKKPEGADLGIEFCDYLMDSERGCANKCVFCFIDQLPKGMRKTLYFKDDDMRLSFLMGNYISLTGLSDEDARRIARLRISPLNISVHTTNPDLRERMLGNKRSGESLKYLREFARAGIAINAQIVVCPGLNDGGELERTLRDLSKLAPSVKSIAVVPVGLTGHREGLYPLEPVSREAALQIIGQVDCVRAENMREIQTPLAFCADEMFLKAGIALPLEEYYADFDQLENGVGLMRLFQMELASALSFEEAGQNPAPFGVVTGVAAAPFMGEMVDTVAQKCDNISYDIFAVDNTFFGHTIDVAGLVTGGDIIAQLKGRNLPKRLLIPKTMLRHGENVFLDDVSISDVERALCVTVQAVEPDGGAFLDAILSTE